MSAYVLAPAAVKDLDEIWLHIALENPEAAERVLNDLQDACQLLAGHPLAGHTREDLADPAIRFWPVRSYLIVYRPEKFPLEIVRFWHGARGVPNVL